MNYICDDLCRLTEEDITNPVLGNETISYSYDNFGNRLSRTDSSGTVNYGYDDNDRLISEGNVTYTYDDNGNMLTKGGGTETITYGYDYENRLVSVQSPGGTTEYAYDADGVRVRSVSNGVVTTHVVDKNRPYAQVLEEKDVDGNLIVSYVYGDDLISQKRGGSVSYYNYEGLGSTRVLTDDAGDVTDTYIYEAFGDIIDHIGNTENNYLFTGEQYDPNAGFYYLRARNYNQTNGRFVSADAWHGSMGDPITLHKYLYANANPVMYSDPSGHMSIAHMSANISMRTLLNAFSRRITVLINTMEKAQSIISLIEGIKDVFIFAHNTADLMKKIPVTGSKNLNFKNQLLDKNFWEDALIDFRHNMPKITSGALRYKRSALKLMLQREGKPSSFVIYMPTGPYTRGPQLKISCGRKFLGKYPVVLSFAGSKKGGRLFGLGVERGSGTAEQIFRMDWHSRHIPKSLETDRKWYSTSGNHTFGYHIE